MKGLAMASTDNVRCGNCAYLDGTKPGIKGYTSGFECKKGKGVRAPGAVAPEECFKKDPKATKFFAHLIHGQ